MGKQQADSEMVKSRFTGKRVSVETARLEQYWQENWPKEFASDLEVLLCKDREKRAALKMKRAYDGVAETVNKERIDSAVRLIPNLQHILVDLLVRCGASYELLTSHMDSLHEAVQKICLRHAEEIPQLVERALMTYELLHPGIEDRRRGEKIEKSAQAGHEQTHGSQAEKEERWAKYKADYEELSERSPHLTQNSKCDIIAKKHGVSAQTIRNHVQSSKKD